MLTLRRFAGVLGCICLVCGGDASQDVGKLAVKDRIYGGDDADITEFPGAASVRLTELGGTVCGAALIASQFAMTAAHCVRSTLWVSVGSRYGAGGTEGERFKVSQSFVHPKYTKATDGYDIALLKLSSPAKAATMPLCRANDVDNPVGTIATAIGWGLTENSTTARTLRKVNLPIISNDDCNNVGFSAEVLPTMLCAGNGDGKDACEGDSGGPLIANNRLVGLVSWGTACGTEPGVFTRVSSYLSFITSTLKAQGASLGSSVTANTTSDAVGTVVAASSRASHLESDVTSMNQTHSIVEALQALIGVQFAKL